MYWCQSGAGRASGAEGDSPAPHGRDLGTSWVPGRAVGSTWPEDVPSSSSLRSHLGLSGSYNSSPPASTAATPQSWLLSGFEDVAGVCFSSQPLLLSLPLSPQLWLLLPLSHHLPWQLLTLPSPSHPAPRAGMHLTAHSSSPIPGHPPVPPGCPQSLTPTEMLFLLPASSKPSLPPPTHSPSQRRQQT